MVPEEILLDTHRGAAITMKEILDMGPKLKKYMDGDIVVAFNKAGVDSEFVKSKNTDGKFKWDKDVVSPKGGSFIKSANYVYVKKSGKAQISSDKLVKGVYDKIKAYVPEIPTWD